jgi:hypothetical protein
MVHVGFQIEIRPVVNALELVPSPREPVLDIERACRIVRQLVGVVGVHPEVVCTHPEIGVPLVPDLDPTLERLISVIRITEVLHLHLLELARPEDELAQE